MWRNQFFSANGQSALRKIQSLDLEEVEPLLPKNLFSQEVPHHYFDELWQAITHRNKIEFTYHSKGVKKRTVAPYSLTLWHSFWYLTGLDCDSGEIRTFKVLRMLDGVRVLPGESSFEIPSHFSPREYLKFQEISEVVLVDFSIRKGKALSLRLSAEVKETATGEWDHASKSYVDIDEGLRDLIFYGDDVRVEGPSDFRTEFIRRISREFAGKNT